MQNNELEDFRAALREVEEGRTRQLAIWPNMTTGNAVTILPVAAASGNAPTMNLCRG